MPLSYRSAIRLEAGDSGVFTRETFSGTGAKTAFWVTGSPIDTLSVVAYVADATVSATPSTDGRVVFASAPASGTDNIEITYQAVILNDTKVDEILRQHGFVNPTNDADAPATVEFYRAAAHLCDAIASHFAGAADTNIDGTDIKRSQMAVAYAKRAADIRQKIAREFASISSMKIKRLDGYAALDEVTSDEYGGNDTNPRRKYYGDEDDIP
jgi:hypothetical protein